MKRGNKHFLIDTVLILLMLITAITGLLVWLVFPYEMGYEEIPHFIEEVHKWASLVLLFVTIYHFIVHWDWYKQVFRKLRP